MSVVPVAWLLSRLLLATLVILCVCILVSSSPPTAIAGGSETVGSVKDVQPLNIEIEKTNSQGTRSRIGPGDPIDLGDSLSIHDWCIKHPVPSEVVVSAWSSEVRLDCIGKDKYTFADHGIMIPQIPISTWPDATTPTITGQKFVPTPTIAVSPSRSPEGVVTTPGETQPSKIGDFLRKGEERPSTESSSKGVVPR
jgi:hypothetical protein